LLSATASALVAGTAPADVNIVKDFRYPIVRTSIMNPQSIDDRCVIREYRVLHRRDADGRPYDLDVDPRGNAETELIPSVIEAFYQWRFKVPGNDAWKTEFLSIVHENTFFTTPPCDCDDSCDKEPIDEKTRALIDNILQE